MSKQMTGAEMIVEALKDQGVDTIFGYPGGAVLPIYDALFQQNAQIPVNLHGIRVHHGSAQALRQSDRQSGLAAGGRSCDENGLRPRRAHAGGLPEACERP